MPLGQRVMRRIAVDEMNNLLAKKVSFLTDNSEIISEGNDSIYFPVSINDRQDKTDSIHPKVE